MGKKFQEEHEEEILHTIEPKVTAILGEAPALHRIHTYSTLLYFTISVSSSGTFCMIVLHCHIPEYADT